MKKAKNLRTLLVNLPRCQREECCSGKTNYNVLPAQIFLSARYLLDKGKDATVIDMQTQKLPDTAKFDIIVVWVSILDGLYEDIEFIKQVKTKSNTTIMILNDPMGCEMDVMEDHPFIDLCIRLHEREIVLEKVIDTLEKEKAIDFPGVIRREGKKLIDTGLAPFLPSLAHLKSSAELLSKLELSKYTQANIITGRGCPMGCTFCQYSRTGFRKRDVKDIMAELDAVSSKVDEIYFLDLNMPANMPWFNQFLDELIKRDNKYNWKTDMRLEACRPELLQKMKKAGCSSVLVGIESVDKTVMGRLNKYRTLDDFDKANVALKMAKIEADFTFMIGFPWDSDESLQALHDFIKKKRITSFGLSLVMPIKGTQLYSDYKKLGLIKELSYKDYVFSRTDDPVSDTLHLKKERVIYWYNKINSIRFTPIYILNYVRNNGFKLRYIKTFFRLLTDQWKRKSRKNT